MKSLTEFIRESEERESRMILEMSKDFKSAKEFLYNRAIHVAEHIILLLAAKYQNPNCDELYEYWIKELYQKHIQEFPENKLKSSNSYNKPWKIINMAYKEIENYDNFVKISKSAVRREGNNHERELAKGKKKYLIKIIPENELYNKYLKILEWLKDAYAKTMLIPYHEFHDYIISI